MYGLRKLRIVRASRLCNFVVRDNLMKVFTTMLNNKGLRQSPFSTPLICIKM